MGQDAQTDFAVLTVIASGPQGGAHVSFEHAENGFDLPALAVCVLWKSVLHQLAIPAAHRAGLAIESWAAAIGGWDDSANAEFVTAKTMEPFRLVAGVTQETGKRLVLQRVVQRLPGLDRIGLGTSVDRDAQDQMIRGVADGRELGIAALVVA